MKNINIGDSSTLAMRTSLALYRAHPLTPHPVMGLKEGIPKTTNGTGRASSFLYYLQHGVVDLWSRAVFSNTAVRHTWSV